MTTSTGPGLVVPTTSFRPFSTTALDTTVDRALRDIPAGKRGQVTGRLTDQGVSVEGAAKIKTWLFGGGYVERQRGHAWTYGGKLTATF